MSRRLSAHFQYRWRLLNDGDFRQQQRELRRLRALRRFSPGQTTLLGKPLRFSDAASYLSAHRTIFSEGIYAFQPAHSNPVILDGGANIGLAVIYWKQCFPDAEITAFEPDPKIFELLRWNCEIRNLDKVTLINEALWDESTTLEFWSQGADGGHLVDDAGDCGTEIMPVQATRLRDFLHRHVDLLKLDIEGAETDVLLDCADAIKNVDNLFVEYHSFIGQNQRLDEMLGVLKQAEFRYHLQPELSARQPFMTRPNSNGKDNRINIYGFRS